MKQLTERQVDLFKRLGRQLEITRDMLARHPIVSNKLSLIQYSLKNFQMQTEWVSAGALKRLLMTIKMAFLSTDIRESSTGFAGAHWLTIQQTLTTLMQATLSVHERHYAPLLGAFNELVTLLLIYYEREVLGDWNQIFIEADQGTIKKAGLFLRELGMCHLVKSEICQMSYSLLVEHLNLNEKSQKGIVHIGFFFLLCVMILVDAEDNPSHAEFVEPLMPFLKRSFPAVEEAANKAQDQRIIDPGMGTRALAQLQLIRQILDNDNAEELRKALQNSFPLFDIPFHEVKNDFTRIFNMNAHIHESLNNVFFQSKQAVTQITHA